MKRVLIAGCAVLSLGTLVAQAAPTLSLTAVGSAQASGSIVEGTGSYTLRLWANTDGQAVSGLQYHLELDGGAATYAAAPTALGTPFTTNDLMAGPVAGDSVSLNSTTAWFKMSNPDYAAFSGPVASYSINTGSLAPGQYTFRAVGEEFTNAASDITTFGSAGSYILNVTAVPEPTSLALLGVGMGLLLRRQRKQA